MKSYSGWKSVWAALNNRFKRSFLARLQNKPVTLWPPCSEVAHSLLIVSIWTKPDFCSWPLDISISLSEPLGRLGWWTGLMRRVSEIKAVQLVMAKTSNLRWMFPEDQVAQIPQCHQTVLYATAKPWIHCSGDGLHGVLQNTYLSPAEVLNDLKPWRSKRLIWFILKIYTKKIMYRKVFTLENNCLENWELWPIWYTSL